MDASNKAYFSAYNQLTIGTWVRQNFGPNKTENVSGGTAGTSLVDFRNAIEQNQVINESDAKDVSKFHEKILLDRMKFSPNPINDEIAIIVEKAFKIGLIGNDEMLISKYKNSI